MEEEPSPVDQPTQLLTQCPQLSKTDGQPQEGTATTMSIVSMQKVPAEPLGSALQAHADPDPSDGGALQGTLPEPQGVDPDVNMAELPDEIIDKAEDTIRALKGDILLTRLGVTLRTGVESDLGLLSVKAVLLVFIQPLTFEELG